MYKRQDSDRLSEVAHLLKGDSNNLADKVRSVLERTRQLEKELQQLKEQAAAQESANLSSKAIDVNGVKLLVSELSGVEPKMLRTMVDDLKNQLGSTIIVLATVAEGKVSLIAGVSKDVTDRVKAGELIGMVAQQVGGKGCLLYTSVFIHYRCGGDFAFHQDFFGVDGTALRLQRGAADRHRFIDWRGECAAANQPAT